MLKLETLLRIGGVLHFGVLFASALVPWVLDWRADLAKVSRFMRQLVWVYGAFIVLVIVGFGALSIAHADTLAGATPVGRSLCGFIAIFWLARLGVQVFVIDARPFLRNLLLKVGDHGLTAVFTYLAIVYGVAAIHPLLRR